MTIRSPFTFGIVETRTSMRRPWIFFVMRPSCGRRLSAMFRPASILTRDTIDL